MLVSIIICTRNRARYLSLCLDAVAFSISTVPEGTDCEIVLVDNGSTDDTQHVLTAWADAHKDIDLRIVREDQKGLSNARNKGMSASKGDLIILTDDDCCMDQNYIVKALEYDAKDVVPVIRGGRIELGDPNDLPLTIKTSDQVEQWSKANRSAKSSPLCGAISGANIVIRRSTANIIGKFDPRLGAGARKAGSDDTDYLCRAYIKGITIEYVPDLIVSHFHGRRTKDQGRKLLRGYNIGAGAIYIKHIFNDFDLFRPFIWNIKNAINEIRQSKNLYLPEYDLSYKNVIVFNLYGMFLFLLYSIGRSGVYTRIHGIK